MQHSLNIHAKGKKNKILEGTVQCTTLSSTTGRNKHGFYVASARDIYNVFYRK